MPRRCPWSSVAVVIAILAAGLAARADDANVTVAGISLGPHIAGPPVDPQSLAGRVVVLEFWGIHCPPCIRSMPGLEELHTSLGPQGLVVIGAHAQGGDPAEVRDAVKQLGVTFPIVDNATVRGAMDFSGIPHCMVFDHTGACIHRGSPAAAHDVIVAAVRAAPAAILGGRTLVKLAPLGQMLRSEESFGVVLKKARAMVDAADADTAEEARFVVERIEDRGRTMLQEARGMADSDPAAAAATVQRCATTFRGSDIGVEATKLAQQWKKDKAFLAAVKAAQQLAKLEALKSAADQAAGGLPPQARGQARDLARAVAKAAPGSAYATKAAAIAAELGAEP